MVDQHVEPRTGGQQPVLGPGSLPPAAPPANEGRTTAAWTTVAIVLVGAVLVAVGLPAHLAALTWVGVAVVLVGLVVGGVLRALGHGQVTSGGRAASH